MQRLYLEIKESKLEEMGEAGVEKVERGWGGIYRDLAGGT